MFKWFLLFTKCYHSSSTCEAGTTFGLKRHNFLALRYATQHLAFSPTGKSSKLVVHLAILCLQLLYPKLAWSGCSDNL